VAPGLEPRGVARASRLTGRPLVRAAWLSLVPLSLAAAIAAAFAGWEGGVAWVFFTAVWAAAGAALLLRRQQERLAPVTLWFSLLAGTPALASAMVDDRPRGGA